MCGRFFPEGTVLSVPTYTIHRDKAVWGEDALEWKPERWLAPLPESVLDAKVPGVYSNLCVLFHTFPQLEHEN